MRKVTTGVAGLLVGAALALAGLAVYVTLTAERALPVYGAAPDFSLIDQDGRVFERGELQGRVVLADFVFTNCTDICPLLSAKLSTVQDALKARGWFGTRVMLLSITVDPERDTPEVLRAYSQRFRAEPSGWRFLTGEPDRVRQVIIDGFHLGLITMLATPADASGSGEGHGSPTVDVMHTDRMVLIDAGGQVRAYLSGASLAAEDLMREIERLR